MCMGTLKMCMGTFMVNKRHINGNQSTQTVKDSLSNSHILVHIEFGIGRFGVDYSVLKSIINKKDD